MPVLRTRDRLAVLGPGDELEVLADDPFASIDLQAFCASHGHDWLGEIEDPRGTWRLRMRKAGIDVR